MTLAKSQNLLSLFSFPTKVVIVDDNVNFIKGMQLLAADHGIEIITFNDPRKALSYLKGLDYCKFARENLIPEENVEIFSNEVVLHLHDLYQEVHNKTRFDEVSTLVIDYAMPGMNGQGFCQQIADLPIKKLLLTGEASYEKATEMFNDGVIDKFIKKSDEYETLFELIVNLQNKYFQSFTEELLFVLKNSSGKSIFSDEQFIQLFNDTLKKNKIIEYYIVDNSGSYLLFNKQGEAKLLIVKSDEDMEVLSDLAANDSDGGIEETTLKSIFNKKKVAFFQTEEDMVLPVAKWHFHDASQLSGNAQNYYYALVDLNAKNTDFRLEKDKIVSYQDYLKAK